MLAEIAARPWAELGWRQFAVLDADDRIIGDIGVNFGSPTVEQVELGFAFAPSARGQDLASEGIGALIERLFERAGVHRIEATTDARNLPTRDLHVLVNPVELVCLARLDQERDERRHTGTGILPPRLGPARGIAPDRIVRSLEAFAQQSGGARASLNVKF